jgi:hypothetical protein
MKRCKLLCAVIVAIAFAQGYAKPAFENFITRSGDKLLDGEKEFRFISFSTSVAIEETYRLQGDKDSWIVYKVPESITKFKVYSLKKRNT